MIIFTKANFFENIKGQSDIGDIFLQNELKQISPFPTKNVEMETVDFSRKPNFSKIEE